MYRFIYWGEIQQKITEFFHSQSGIPLFPYAFKELLNAPVHESEILPIPDFASWDCQDADELYTLFCRFPVLVESTVTHPITHTPEQAPVVHTFSNADLGVLFCSRNENAFVCNDAFSVYYILKGTASLTIDDHKHWLSSGSLLIVAPHTSYRFASQEDCVAISIYVWRKRFDSIIFKPLKHNQSLLNFSKKALTKDGQQFLLFQITDPKEPFFIIRALCCESYNQTEFS